MAKTTNKKKAEAGSDLLESSDALREQLTKTEQFLEQNKIIVFSILGIVIVAVSATLLFRYYTRSQDEKAQVDMFQAVYYFEADSLDKALLGDGNNFGFLDIIDTYRFTKSANLANYYAGLCYLKKGDYDNAIEYLKGFSVKDVAVQARTYALIGDAYMEKKEYNTAAGFYKKAAEYKENEYFSPIYLEKAAIAYEALMDFESAEECFNLIMVKYSKSTQFQNAQKQKARLEGLAKN